MQTDDTIFTGVESVDSTFLAGDEPDDPASVEGVALDASSPLEGDGPDGSNSLEGDELDDLISLEDRQPQGSTFLKGNDQEASTSFEGDELDDSTPFEGDELDDSTPIGSRELDGAPLEEAGEPQDPMSGGPARDEKAHEREEPTATGRRKRIIVPAVGGLCALALGAAMYGTVFRPEKTVVPAAVPIAVSTNSSQDFDDFLIPFHRESNHYISFSISLRSADGAVLNELAVKKEIFRGRIYDLLKAHVDKAAGHPSLAATKEKVAEGVNAWLSAGRLDGVYITQFLIR